MVKIVLPLVHTKRTRGVITWDACEGGAHDGNKCGNGHATRF